MEYEKLISGLLDISNTVKNSDEIGKGAIQTVLSIEDFDSETQVGAERQSLDLILNKSIKSMFVLEGMDENSDIDDILTPAQIQAGKDAVALASDPETGLNRRLLSEPIDGNEDNQIVNMESYESSSVNKNSILTVTTEGFDGQSVDNALKFTLTTAIMTSKQDALTEMFFPTIMINPAKTGIKVYSTIELLQDNFIREGQDDSSRFNYKTMIDGYMDINTFSSDKNRLVPVYDEDRTDVYFTDITYVDNSSGEEITTSPLLVNETIPIVGLSQSKALLAKGVRTDKDTLDSSVMLDTLYLKLTNDDESVTEIFKMDMSLFPYRTFRDAGQGDTKNIMMIFKTADLSFKLGDIKPVGKDESALLKDLADNYIVKLNVELVGKGNVLDGNINVSSLGKISINKVIRDTGDILPKEDQVYKDIEAVFNNISSKAYSVEAYVTNSNLRHSGETATTSTYSETYSIPYRTGTKFDTPITNKHDKDNDANSVGSLIKLINMKIEHHGVRTLLGFADTMRLMKESGVLTKSSEVGGLGRRHVLPYTDYEVIDVLEHMDSTRSKERTEDLEAVLANKIKLMVEKAYTDSQYKLALKLKNGGIDKTMHLMIGTDPITASYLPAKLDLGKNIQVHIETSELYEFKGKLVMSFGVFDGNRNSKPNELNFGQMFKSTEITTDIQRENNGEVYRQLVTNPRYRHIINLPIIFTIDIINIPEAFSKNVRLSSIVGTVTTKAE